jgi:mono/diheme cytochrome c family protein
MPGFHDALTVGEIAAILAYIKSTWPADIRARQNRLNVTR